MSTSASDDAAAEVLDGSTVVRTIRRGIAGSTVASRLRDRIPDRPAWRSVPDRWRDDSRTLAALTTLERATGQSGLARAADEGSTWVRSSFLYRWLTAEPEPEVIVIDLRETFTVRPFIVALDEALGVIGLGLPTSAVGNAADRTLTTVQDVPIRIASAVLAGLLSVALVATVALGDPSTVGVLVQVVLLGVAALGLRVDASWDEVRESRPVRLLVAVLEPPEPPEEYREPPQDPTDDEDIPTDRSELDTTDDET